MIEHAVLAAAFLQGIPAITKLLQVAGVPVPPGLPDAMTKGLAGVVELLEAVGCAITGCPTETTELDTSDVVDEAKIGRDAYHELSKERNGISRR